MFSRRTEQNGSKEAKGYPSTPNDWNDATAVDPRTKLIPERVRAMYENKIEMSTDYDSGLRFLWHNLI